MKTYSGFEAFMHDAPAAEALRKARATERCRISPIGMRPDCTLVNGEDFNEIFVDTGHGWRSRNINHRVQASALLDGFSVDEVTAAEEVLG